MKINLILGIIHLLTAVSCLSQEKVYVEEVKNHIFKLKVYPDAKSQNAILVTPILDKDDYGVYVFKKKGPHRINRLIFKQGNEFEIIDRDSSVSYIEERTAHFLLKNALRRSEKRVVEKQIQELVIDYKESEFLNN